MGGRLTPRLDKKSDLLLRCDKSTIDLLMNSLIMQLRGQNPGLVIIPATVALVSTLNDMKVSVEQSVLRGIRRVTLVDSKLSTPLLFMYSIIMSVVVFAENLVT